jgi:Cu/Ag efflux pump CusA
MKDFLNRLQKDISRLQETIEKESNDLLAKARKAANEITRNNNVAAKTREIEKLVEQKMKKFEPALYKFLEDLSKNAAKYGLDVSDVEKRVKTGYNKAKSKVVGLKVKKTRTTKKKATTKKATTKKVAAKKGSTKKTPNKKVSPQKAAN